MVRREPLHSRFLVIGSGIAGLQYALLAARHGSVRVATKKESSESATNYAQGGIAAVLSPLDQYELHVADTMKAGDGLCREKLVRAMVEAAPRLIERLAAVGVCFTRQTAAADAPLALGREGGHSRHRIVHAQDLTGREIEARLLGACQDHPDIDIRENHLGLDLIRGRAPGPDGQISERVVGCWVLDRRTLRRQAWLADVVVLATGGCGKVYSYTSNPDIATGDGLAMAFRAGATLANLEFVQFHPTCLYHPAAKSFLISEAVRGEGAHLINGRGVRFMEGAHPLGDLAPRDVVARGIDQEMKATGERCVYLDLRHLERRRVEARFPHLVATCRRFGIDMAGEPVPVVPAAHYMCGGVRTDEHGRTDVPGLYAIGEVACTGVHGANRLASNSLLEAVYFAERAAAAGAVEPSPGLADGALGPLVEEEAGLPGHGPEHVVLEHDWDTVRRVMWDYVGIVRSRERLDIALSRVRAIRRTVEGIYRASSPSAELAELRNISLVAELIVLCARARHESRGLHWTVDYPDKLPGTPRNTLVGGRRGLRASEAARPGNP